MAKTITLPDAPKETLSALLVALLALAAAGLLDAPEGWQQADAEESEDGDEAEDSDEEDEAPKGKKGKKAKKDDDEAEEEEEAEDENEDEAEEEESEDDAEEESDDEPELDKEAVRKELKKLVAKNRDDAVALLKKFKAKTIDDLDEDVYAKVVAAIKKALKG